MGQGLTTEEGVSGQSFGSTIPLNVDTESGYGAPVPWIRIQ